MGGGAGSERVNVWPLLHKEDDGLALLWPLFDVDSRGFALRPLVAHDDTKWEVLYPWAAHDTRTGRGWALPAYWTKDVAGCFPLFHFGAFNYVGLAYWRNEGGRTVWGGVFPLALFGELNHVGPVWWTPADGGYGVFPLFGAGSVRHVGPVWWRRAPTAGRAWGVFPLLWSSADAREFALLPLYMHSLGEARRTRTYLFGLARTDAREDGHRNWFAPLYYDSLRDAGEKRDQVFAPFYYLRKRADETRVFTLLGDRGVRDDGGSFNLYPLWWSNRTADSAMKMLLPLFYYEEDGDQRALLTPLGGRGWSASGATRYLNVLGPLYHHSASDDGRRERTAVLWPFYERASDGDERTTRSVPFFSSTTRGEASEGWYALGLGHFRSSPKESSQRFWPLFSATNQARAPGWMYDATLYGQREDAAGSERWLFPLYAGERTSDGFERRYLLGLGAHAERHGETSWRAWPLASSSKFETRRDWLSWTTLFGRRERPESRTSHVLTPLVYLSERVETPTRRASTTHLLTGVRLASEERLGLVVPTASGAAAESLHSRREHSLFFGLYTNRLERFVAWKPNTVPADDARVLERFSSRYAGLGTLRRDEAAAREILARHDRDPRPDDTRPDDPRAFDEQLAAFVAERSHVVARRSVNVPLVWDYERDWDSREWSGPLGLIHSRRDARGSKFSFLYYAYRSATTGDATRRDIFPFVTWDSAPRSTEISFLWRVLRFKREDGKSGGHVLFVPWGAR
jgi:hypothetical protein